MKTSVVIALAICALARPCLAQWAVLDVANLSQSAANYGAMVEQIAKQGEQVANQVRQIQQMEAQLKRLGNMADVRALIGFPELKLDLNLPTRIRVWAQSTARVDGAGLFGDTRGGLFRAIESQFANFGGGSIERQPELYRPAQGLTTAVDEFKEVQSDVYTRRADLRKAIAGTSDALLAAATDAEEQKLAAVLNAQYGQLAALDSEVALSAAEIQVRAAESTAMTTARQAADAEERTEMAHQEAQKIGDTFKPIYTSILTYVREERFTP